MSAMASQITSLTIVYLTALCERNSPVTGEFPTQSARKKDNVSFDDVNMDHGTDNLLQMLFRFGELCVPLF